MYTIFFLSSCFVYLISSHAHYMDVYCLFFSISGVVTTLFCALICHFLSLSLAALIFVHSKLCKSCQIEELIWLFSIFCWCNYANPQINAKPLTSTTYWAKSSAARNTTEIPNEIFSPNTAIFAVSLPSLGIRLL